MDPPSEAEFAAFVAASWRRLVQVAYLIAGDWGEAEDLVQSALANCYRHWPRIVAGGAELAYVRKAILNAHLSNVRRRRLREIVTFAVPEHAQEAGSHPSDDRDLLRRALSRLPHRSRTAVVLRHYADLSEQETAAAMSCSVGNVKRLTADGLRRLRAYCDIADPSLIPLRSRSGGRHS